MRRTCFLAIAALLLIASGTARAQLPTTFAYAVCSADSFYVIWTTYDPDPYGYPNWMGFDIMRRAVPGCGEYEMLNADVIPRAFVTTTQYFGGVTPYPGKEYEYIVRPVDADHQLVAIPGFCLGLSCNAYATCAPTTTPAVIGTVVDWGWAVAINPCPGSCYPGVYLENSAGGDALRPYAGTSTTVRLFGVVGCGSVEGCSISQLDHWDLGPCDGITPTSSHTWGQVKIRYR